MATISLMTNAASLGALRRLASVSQDLGKTYDHLSSGLRITRASDDAAGLSVASSLSADARVFDQGVRNVNDGISYLSLAEGGTAALRDVLIRLRELATQSSNGTVSNTQRQALDKEFQGLVQEYNRVLGTAQFQGRAVFDPHNASLSVQAGYSTLTADLGSTTTTIVGDGTFQARQAFATGPAPSSVTIGDFNDDGRPDMAIADSAVTSVSILLGNGDGTFQAQQVFSTGNSPFSVATGDFNGDGKLDLVTANWESHSGTTASILLGNGDGTFGSPQMLTTGTGPVAVAVADLNGDGISDLATTGSLDGVFSTISIHLGHGDGTFAPQQTFTTGQNPDSIVAADLNGDGKPDLVTANQNSNTLSVLLGNGDGSFGAAQPFTVGANPYSAVAVDVNSDGRLDLVSADYGPATGSTVSVLLGNGNGTFQPRLSYSTGVGPVAVAAADLNGDGKPDLVTADLAGGSGNTLSVLLGNGDGTFQPRVAYTTGNGPRSLTIGDLNGDGVQDLVSPDYFSSGYVSVLLGNATVTTTFTGLTAIGGMSVDSRVTALAAQGLVDNLLDRVDSVEGSIGAAMNRFETAARVLQTSSENFRQAESRIADADVAEEAALLTRGRILQQAAASVLASANQQPELTIKILS